MNGTSGQVNRVGRWESFQDKTFSKHKQGVAKGEQRKPRESAGKAQHKPR